MFYSPSPIIQTISNHQSLVKHPPIASHRPHSWCTFTATLHVWWPPGWWPVGANRCILCPASRGSWTPPWRTAGPWRPCPEKSGVPPQRWSPCIDRATRGGHVSDGCSLYFWLHEEAQRYCAASKLQGRFYRPRKGHHKT